MATEFQPALISADHFFDDEQQLTIFEYLDSSLRDEVLAAVNASSNPTFTIDPETAAHTFVRNSSDVGDMIFRAHSLADELKSRGIPSFVFSVSWDQRVRQ